MEPLLRGQAHTPPGVARRVVEQQSEGIPFLGFVVYPERRRLKRRKGVAYARRLRQMAGQYADGEISLDQVTASVQGWANHLRYGNTIGLRKALLGDVLFAAPTGRRCASVCNRPGWFEQGMAERG